VNLLAAQGLRYVVVGAASNAALYCVYLLLTRLGVGPKSAASALYAVGVIQTFHFQRRWTFSHEGRCADSLARYLAAYFLCYLGNMAALRYFVDVLGWRHEAVQAGAIVVFALVLFLLQRFWVFRARPETIAAMGD
jgi:putative flippase GtrA